MTLSCVNAHNAEVAQAAQATEATQAQSAQVEQQPTVSFASYPAPPAFAPTKQEDAKTLKEAAHESAHSTQSNSFQAAQIQSPRKEPTMARVDDEAKHSERTDRGLAMQEFIMNKYPVGKGKSYNEEFPEGGNAGAGAGAGEIRGDGMFAEEANEDLGLLSEEDAQALADQMDADDAAMADQMDADDKIQVARHQEKVKRDMEEAKRNGVQHGSMRSFSRSVDIPVQAATTPVAQVATTPVAQAAMNPNYKA
jgi:hypothetical protein